MKTQSNRIERTSIPESSRKAVSSMTPAYI